MIIFLAMILITAGILIYLNKRSKRKQNEVVPYAVGSKSIHLKRSEIPHFEKLTRTEQRKIINRIEAKAKSGKFKKIYEQGKFKGYVRG